MALSNSGTTRITVRTVPLVPIEAEELIIKAAGVKDPKEIQEFEKEKRDKVIHGLKKSGLSIRQIERLTGVSFGIIRGK